MKKKSIRWIERGSGLYVRKDWVIEQILERVGGTRKDARERLAQATKENPLLLPKRIVPMAKIFMEN